MMRRNIQKKTPPGIAGWRYRLLADNYFSLDLIRIP
jgi:hypothetical protein